MRRLVSTRTQFAGAGAVQRNNTYTKMRWKNRGHEKYQLRFERARGLPRQSDSAMKL
jgi:hypothetical protein